MDLLLCENGDGGDFIMVNNDFVITEGLENQPYLGWFGGNLGGEESDREQVPQSEQRKDWWGNDLLFDPNLDFKFKSEFETALDEIELSSVGRIRLEETAADDLAFLSDLGTVTVTATIPKVDTLKITAVIQQPDQQEDQTFEFIWDATKNEGFCRCNDYIRKELFVPDGNYSFNYNSVNYNVL